MKRVLMIAHAFPPGRGPGVHRPAAFARHLPGCGWQPVVLTVESARGDAGDRTALEDLPQDLAVIRTPWIHARGGPRQGPAAAHLDGGSGKRSTGSGRGHGRSRAVSDQATRASTILRRWLRTYVLVPDEAVGWLPFAVPTALSAARDMSVDALYSTSGPPTAHLVALAVHRATALPWVADFRDPWTAVPNAVRREIYRSRLRLSVDRSLERRVLSAADAVVTVSQAQREIMRALTPRAAQAVHRVITNGYEPEWLSASVQSAPEQFTIVYTGSFYRAGEEPDPLFRVLRGLLASGALQAERLRVVVAGPQHARVAAAAAEYGIDEIVDVRPPLPHSDALSLQRSATVLWLALSPVHGRQGALTAKLFEYMAARRPVLALVVPDSEAGRLVASTGIGVAVDPRDEAGLVRELLDLDAEYVGTGTVAWRGSDEAIAPYSRARLTARLAELLDEIVAERQG